MPLARLDVVLCKLASCKCHPGTNHATQRRPCMNNNNGRDKLWNDAIWQDIDKAVLAEIGRIRVAQKIFPSSPMSNGSYVPADIFDPDTMSIAEGQTKPFIEISVEFPLTQTQVENEATLKTGRTLARLATKSLALAEDLLFFQGADAKLPPEIRVVNRNSAQNGLLGVAAQAK